MKSLTCRIPLLTLGVAMLLWVAPRAVSQTPTPDHLVLHPNGFGEHSYAAWKAQVGLADDTGGANQALYFQKMTLTANFAAGVAVIEGVEGLPTSALTGLSWYIRDPVTGGDHCGAGAPRWNVRVRLANTSQTFFFGCAAMADTGSQTSPDGHLYLQKTVPLTVLGVPVLPAGTITALSILFDEGDDQGSGFAHLDNIDVQLNGVDHVWTAAADNGNNP